MQQIQNLIPQVDEALTNGGLAKYINLIQERHFQVSNKVWDNILQHVDQDNVYSNEFLELLDCFESFRDLPANSQEAQLPQIAQDMRLQIVNLRDVERQLQLTDNKRQLMLRYQGLQANIQQGLFVEAAQTCLELKNFVGDCKQFIQQDDTVLPSSMGSEHQDQPVYHKIPSIKDAEDDNIIQNIYQDAYSVTYSSIQEQWKNYIQFSGFKEQQTVFEIKVQTYDSFMQILQAKELLGNLEASYYEVKESLFEPLLQRLFVEQSVDVQADSESGCLKVTYSIDQGFEVARHTSMSEPSDISSVNEGHILQVLQFLILCLSSGDPKYILMLSNILIESFVRKFLEKFTGINMENSKQAPLQKADSLWYIYTKLEQVQSKGQYIIDELEYQGLIDTQLLDRVFGGEFGSLIQQRKEELITTYIGCQLFYARHLLLVQQDYQGCLVSNRRKFGEAETKDPEINKSLQELDDDDDEDDDEWFKEAQDIITQVQANQQQKGKSRKIRQQQLALTRGIYQITLVAYNISKVLEDILDKYVHQENGTSKEALLDCVRNISCMVYTVMPQTKKRDLKIPNICLQYAQDFQFLSDELILVSMRYQMKNQTFTIDAMVFRDLSQEYLQQTINLYKEDIGEFFKLFGGFNEVTDDKKDTEACKLFQQVAFRMYQISTQLETITTPPAYIVVLGNLIDFVSLKISQYILEMDDISLTMTERIPTILSPVTSTLIKFLFDKNLMLSYKVPKRQQNDESTMVIVSQIEDNRTWCQDQIQLIGHGYKKLQQILHLLKVNLKTIIEMWNLDVIQEAGISEAELKKLILAIFEETDYRHDQLNNMKSYF